MHQYINFYELIIQNTNLSPTKNQLEFFKEVISDYQSLNPEKLIDRMNELFRINKSNFPNNYTLIDFINTIFNISRFIKDKSKVSSEVLKQEDINNKEKIKEHILTMLNYRKDEKIYKLLLAKKESVKGEILDAMEKGENVVLDEIDKVQEKEIE
jgi:translation initiation factor 2B subunit (eIF-2B alpha/beta/delta family)